MDQVVKADARSESSRTEGHALQRSQFGRQPDYPISRYADILPEPAIGVHAQIIAGHQNPVSLTERLAPTGCDHAGGIDARGVRVVTGNPFISGGRKCVFIIKG